VVESVEEAVRVLRDEEIFGEVSFSTTVRVALRLLGDEYVRENWEIEVEIPEVLEGECVYEVWEEGGVLYATYKRKGEDAGDAAERQARWLRERGFDVEVETGFEKAFVSVKLRGGEEAILRCTNLRLYDEVVEELVERSS